MGFGMVTKQILVGQADLFELSEHIRIDEVTGDVFWKLEKKGRELDRPFGTKFKFMNVAYRTSQVVWAIHQGRWSEKSVWFIDGNELNFRIENLTDEQPVCDVATDDDFRNEHRYDHESGFIFRMDGSRAETYSKSHGRTYGWVRLRKRKVQAHRLAWFLHYGHWPEFEIDHENHITTDNRICNIRDVPHAVNMRNLKLKKSNKTGVNGVHKCSRNGRYYATASMKSGSTKVLGSSSSVEVAAEIRRYYEASVGYHENHGKEFSPS